MDAAALARGQALGRIALGSGFLLAPGLVGRGWVGSGARNPGARAFATGLAARDLAIGLATLRALDAGHGARDWIRAGLAGDAADVVATLRARDELAPLTGPAVGLLAAASVALGAYLQSALD